APRYPGGRSLRGALERGRAGRHPSLRAARRRDRLRRGRRGRGAAPALPRLPRKTRRQGLSGADSPARSAPGKTAAGRGRPAVPGPRGLSAYSGLLRTPSISRVIETLDRKSTRLNSSRLVISYAVF